MLGAVVGDVVGSRFEWNNHRSKDFDFFDDACMATDDSIMTIAIAKAIMEADKQSSKGRLSGEFLELLSKLAIKYMQEIGRDYPNCGYGGKFYQWMFSEDPKPYDSYGNGAAMRVSPAGFAARSEEEAKALSSAVTAVTHNHPEGLKGAEATAIAIFIARNGATMDEIKARIEKDYYPMDFTIDEIRHSYRFNESCQGTVPQAIKCFLESTSFEDAVRTAISLGGDSDTVAAIAGGIAEAYYGVPDDIRDEVVDYLEDELFEIYIEWIGFMRTNKSFDDN